MVRWLRRVYEPALEFVLANRIVTFARRRRCSPLLAVVARALARASNSCPSWRKAISGSAPLFRSRSRWRTATATSTACGVLMAGYPEVQSVVSQHGRPDDGTDATGFFNAEFFVPLKPLRCLARRRSTRKS